MNKNFTLKLLSLLLALMMLTSVFVSCVGENGSNVTTTLGDTTTTTTSGTGSSTTTSTTGNSGSSSTTTTTKGNGGTDPDVDCVNGHVDTQNGGDDYCDVCSLYVVEVIDFYTFNDLHGKLEDGDNHPGVDEVTAYLENRKNIDDHVVLLSAGDMWQGGSASNETHGRIITDWMNYLDFDAMTLGNHEFDWGQDAVKTNVDMAEFPILAINIYDNATGKRVDYCQPSVMVERGGVQIGIIGAIGDCYSSISSENTQGINFKVGSALTSLVKAESEKLRSEGADIIVYVIHDGTEYDNIKISDYYDETLSRDGYVDLVFGGHTHSYYVKTDSYGVPHLQGGGDNKTGIIHVEVKVNFANGNIKYTTTECLSHSTYTNLEGSSIVQDLINKYWDEIGWIYDTLGYNATNRNSNTISSTVAKLYYEAGVAKWGDKYNIVLGGGQLNIRSPYYVYAGNVQYSDLQMVLPFDNPLYLCKIKGSDLKSKFINNSSYTKYSTVTASQVKDNEYYYIIADSWTALYDWAKCTVVEIYNETTFARDLLAQYIRNGGWSK